ncbi:YdcH family protein [Thalassolituus sp.]|uniref:YdcH family protein n=1 Tax=Thalassolituus sp. TaxID=2030822 RepID=UPI0035191AD4
MNVEHHDLHHDFPDMSEQIRELKMNDRHFARLFDEYHELDKEVRKIEEDATPASDDTLDALRVKRVHLKDDLYAMLKEA